MTKTTDLTAATAVGPNDVCYVVQSGTGKKANASLLRGIIATAQLTGTTNTITFSSIPSDFENLRLIATVKSSSAVANEALTVTVNGLTTAIYDRQSHFANNTSPGADQALSSTSWAPVQIPGASGEANEPGVLKLELPHYAKATAFYRQMLCHARQPASTTTGTAYVITGAGQVRTTSAISSITVSATGNLTGDITLEGF